MVAERDDRGKPFFPTVGERWALRPAAGHSVKGFVRAKKKGARTYYYWVVSERLGKKIRQRTLFYLGECPSIEAALETWAKEVERCRAKAAELKESARQTRARLPPAFVDGKGWCSNGSPIKRDVYRLRYALQYGDRYEQRARELEERLAKLRRLLQEVE